MISYYVNTPGMACSHHLDDRLPELKKLGIAPVVLSSFLSPKSTEYRHIRAPHIAPSAAQRGLRSRLKTRLKNKILYEAAAFVLFLPLLPFYLIEKLFVRAYPERSWLAGALFPALWLAASPKREVIYCTGGHVHASLCGAIVSSLTGKPLIAEFQDPLRFIYPDLKLFEGKRSRAIERFIVKRAWRTVYLTRNAAEDAQKSTGNQEAIRHIYAGSGPAEPVASGPALLGPGENLDVPDLSRASKRRNEYCRIVHVGTLYQTRTFKPVLDVLDNLGNTEIPFRIQLLGIVAPNVVEEIEASPFKDVVEISGVVDRSQALEAMQQADLQLLIQHRDEISTYTIPSKTFEYLNSGRRILGFLFHNEELESMLKEQGHFVAPETSPWEGAEILRRCLEMWEKGTLDLTPNASPYTTERAALILTKL